MAPHDKGEPLSYTDIPVEAEGEVKSAPQNETLAEENVSGTPEEVLKKLRIELKETKAEAEAKKAEYDAVYDKYLRMAAEYENFRKRTAKEKESIYTDAVTGVLSDLLPVFDNIERAVQFNESDNLADGIKMIHSQFKASFAKLDVIEIPAVGEKFDPAVHNAVMHEQDDSEDENMVREVLQKGYARGERVIRPAMVKVVN